MHKVLVIDDELHGELGDSPKFKRYQLYDKISGENFETVPVNTKDDIETYTSPEKFGEYSIVLLDLDLSLANGLQFGEVAKRIGNSCPVIVMSNKWGNALVGKLKAAFDFKVNVCHLVDLSKFTDLDAAVEELSGLVNSELLSGSGVKTFKPNQTIRILHISDPQFGGVHESFAEAAFCYLPRKLINQFPALNNEEDKKSLFVAVTGDIAEHGLPSQYSKASEKIKTLYRQLKGAGPCEDLLLVPGNHDMQLGLANAQWLRPSKEVKEAPKFVLDFGKEEPGLSKFSFSPFLDFAAKLNGKNMWGGEIKKVWSWDKLRYAGLIVAGVNTCMSVGKDGWYIPKFDETDNIKTLFEDEYQAITEAHDGRVEIPEKYFRILLMHHPVETELEDKAKREKRIADKEQIGDKESFSLFCDAYPIDLVLCGHLHANGPPLVVSPEGVERKTYQVCASTSHLGTALRKPDANCAVNFIELERRSGWVSKVTITEIQLTKDGHGNVSYDFQEPFDLEYESSDKSVA